MERCEKHVRESLLTIVILFFMGACALRIFIGKLSHRVAAFISMQKMYLLSYFIGILNQELMIDIHILHRPCSPSLLIGNTIPKEKIIL